MAQSTFPTRRLLQALRSAGLVLAAVFVIGTVGYKVIGGGQATWVDSLYMTFITIATIGYSEVIDLGASPGGRIFTMVIAFSGICTMSYMLSTFTVFMLESDLNRAMRRRRMKKEIANLRDHYIICGVGRVGSNVADELIATGRPFALVEPNEATLAAYVDTQQIQYHITGDATDDATLIEAGIKQAAGVFAVTGDDSKNLVIALSAKQLNPKVRVVARIHDIKNADKTRRAGADEIVCPDFTGGLRIASAMIRPTAVTFLDQMLRREDGLRVEEVRVPHHASKRTLGELNVRSKDHLVVAVKSGATWHFNPDDAHLLHEGDTLIVMCSPSGRDTLARSLIGTA